ncbi:uncharacterized protein TrAtP1_002357 [Trichoderma atroviride]|uniref:uncharacterized protein n=1 Tax=Hypocrea atroviridis TaxID=63577 RepID=UPI003330D0D5|nr:hypothetical protein TrAtP1_002357 [Trichoderma atroviride]
MNRFTSRSPSLGGCIAKIRKPDGAYSQCRGGRTSRGFRHSRCGRWRGSRSASSMLTGSLETSSSPSRTSRLRGSYTLPGGEIVFFFYAGSAVNSRLTLGTLRSALKAGPCFIQLLEPTVPYQRGAIAVGHLSAARPHSYHIV